MNTPTTPSRRDSETEITIAQINARQIILVTIITAASGIVGAVIQGVLASGKIETLKNHLISSTSKVKDLQNDLEGPSASTVERDALYRLTSNSIESDLALTAEKRNVVKPAELADNELNYRRLRRAVFLNMDILRANRTILENTFDTLTKRGHRWVDGQKARLISEFPEIKATRLRWLEDAAVPRLQHSIDEKERHPLSRSVPAAEVPSPRGLDDRRA